MNLHMNLEFEFGFFEVNEFEFSFFEVNEFEFSFFFKSMNLN